MSQTTRANLGYVALLMALGLVNSGMTPGRAATKSLAWRAERIAKGEIAKVMPKGRRVGQRAA